MLCFLYYNLVLSINFPQYLFYAASRDEGSAQQSTVPALGELTVQWAQQTSKQMTLIYDAGLMTGEQSKTEVQKRTTEPSQDSWSGKLPGALFLSLHHETLLKTELVTGCFSTSIVPRSPMGLLALHKYHLPLCMTVFYMILQPHSFYNFVNT